MQEASVRAWYYKRSISSQRGEIIAGWRSRPGCATGGYGIGYDPFYVVYYDSWGMNHTTQIDQYTEGKLNIDAIDVKLKKLVWQGSTKGRLTNKAKQNYQVTLDEAVNEIFEFASRQD